MPQALRPAEYPTLQPSSTSPDKKRSSCAPSCAERALGDSRRHRFNQQLSPSELRTWRLFYVTSTDACKQKATVPSLYKRCTIDQIIEKNVLAIWYFEPHSDRVTITTRKMHGKDLRLQSIREAVRSPANLPGPRMVRRTQHWIRTAKASMETLAMVLWRRPGLIPFCSTWAPSEAVQRQVAVEARNQGAAEQLGQRRP